jgi:hypothetical protein
MRGLLRSRRLRGRAPASRGGLGGRRDAGCIASARSRGRWAGGCAMRWPTEARCSRNHARAKPAVTPTQQPTARRSGNSTRLTPMQHVPGCARIVRRVGGWHDRGHDGGPELWAGGWRLGDAIAPATAVLPPPRPLQTSGLAEDTLAIRAGAQGGSAAGAGRAGAPPRTANGDRTHPPR